MADRQGRQKTFGEKAGSFFRKAALTAIFAGVAGAGGAGYHHYGTKEDVVAKVTSVEMKPPASQGERPVMLVHTDKGTFVNQPALAYLKGEGETREIAGKLRPGVTAKFTVYGLNPKLGRFSPDDFRIHRNIAGAVVEGAALPLASSPAPVRAVIPPAPPVPAEESLAAARARMPAAQVCAANSNGNDMVQKLPRLARDLEVMAQLPLTGRPVYNVVTDPANGIRSCIFPADPKQDSTSTYARKTAKIASSSNGLTTVHEYFHAFQDMNGGKLSYSRLTMRDAVVDNLLQEAAAVAYEMAAQREAKNRGLSFYEPPAVRETRSDGSVTVWSITKSSMDGDNIAAFNRAYDASWRQNAAADAETREAKALEAGGRAVVRRLLAGEDEGWKDTYTDLALSNVNRNAHIFGRVNGNAPGYAAKRDDAFKKMGAVSAKINFIPEEYIGPNAGYHIEKCFKGMGFTIEKSARAPAPSAPR